MKYYKILFIGVIVFSHQALANKTNTVDISSIISKKEFLSYKNVGEFIEHSPKVTTVVKPEKSDINQYGPDVVKTLTGSDCDRDGVMDDNPKCNAVFYKLWLKYKR